VSSAFYRILVSTTSSLHGKRSNGDRIQPCMSMFEKFVSQRTFCPCSRSSSARCAWNRRAFGNGLDPYRQPAVVLVKCLRKLSRLKMPFVPNTPFQHLFCLVDVLFVNACPSRYSFMKILQSIEHRFDEHTSAAFEVRIIFVVPAQ